MNIMSEDIFEDGRPSLKKKMKRWLRQLVQLLRTVLEVLKPVLLGAIILIVCYVLLVLAMAM